MTETTLTTSSTPTPSPHRHDFINEPSSITTNVGLKIQVDKNHILDMPVLNSSPKSFNNLVIVSKNNKFNKPRHANLFLQSQDSKKSRNQLVRNVLVVEQERLPTQIEACDFQNEENSLSGYKEFHFT